MTPLVHSVIELEVLISGPDNTRTAFVRRRDVVSVAMPHHSCFGRCEVTLTTARS